ncbi:VOC family protein [Actinacidiphila rubida]|uniref:Glyoxalase/Bleomycin resistance protein/Dioxygenase superfamily protein n=1 Tax=Actinacidiphila rubida TaxID=310780 RepID=A0A1H8MWB7_9ACTN|nr:glyoxalase/bleomycin resistance/extradiol dioxygenase family protein [Actinacidiphila rubida]SEO21546.1 Glyoxalase/Bleomycin resistance protein/Dioxygenase superfamily protein [Actinacidiphila rubida]
MTRIDALCFDANDPQELSRFWGEFLGWERTDEVDGPAVLPADDTGFRLRFLPTEATKSRQNQMHFDLTSRTPETQQETVDRALALGARHIDIGQRPEERHVVLADPEGNEFCVIPAGNSFLAGCPFIGAVSSDGSQAVGYFWSKALDWPLVWDQDEETAIRSPHGGPKVTWGGPPVAPKHGRNRLHFDLAVPSGGAPASAADRLVSLGAARADTAPCAPGWIAMTDPDGNEFCLRPAR